MNEYKHLLKLQIEQMLSERKHQELIAMQASELRERIAEEQAQSALLHSSVAGLMEEFSRWLWEQENKHNTQHFGNTMEAEIYDEENDWELY